MSPFVPPSRVRSCDRSLALGIFLLALALFTATFTGVPENADAEVEYQTTSSLARRGRLDIGGTPEAAALIAASPPGREGLGFGVAPGGSGREDRWYSWFGVGQAVAGVPLWFIGDGLARLFPEVEERHATTTLFGVARSEYFSHLLVGWRNCLLTALTAWLLVLTSRRAGASGRGAFVAGLSYCVATFAWPQARSTLSDVQAGFFLFLGFHLLLLAKESWMRLRRPPTWPLLGAGFALGWTFFTRVAVAPAVAFLGLVAIAGILMRSRRARTGWTPGSLTALGLPFLACAAAFLITNQMRFGDVMETGYGVALSGQSFFSFPPHLGAAGALLSPGRGLLWMAPGVLLVPLGLMRARERGLRWLPWILLGVAAAILAPVSFMQGWHGAWTYGPRYLLPALPFLWVLVALGLDQVADWPVRRIAARTVLWAGLATSVPGVLVDYTTHHEMAEQAARLAWPEVAGENAFQKDGDRFLRIQWDLRFAAPWAHWRILRHRGAGLGDVFPVREVFFLDTPVVLAPNEPRRQGMRHFAWVDFQERLGGAVWPAILLCLTLFAAGLAAAGRGLDDPSV